MSANSMDVGFRALGRVEDALVGIIRTVAADIAHFFMDLVHDFAPPLFQDPLQLCVPFPVHVATRGFMNAHDDSAPFPLLARPLSESLPDMQGTCQLRIPAVYSRNRELSLELSGSSA
jgi:hypothetical protein